MAQKPSSSGGSGAPGGKNPGSGDGKPPGDTHKAAPNKAKKALRVGPNNGRLQTLGDYDEQYADHMARKVELRAKYLDKPQPTVYDDGQFPHRYREIICVEHISLENLKIRLKRLNVVDVPGDKAFTRRLEYHKAWLLDFWGQGRKFDSLTKRAR